MNVVPNEFVRVKPDDLKGFIRALFRKADVPEAGAALMADLLVATDLRGVFSHGTRQAPGYASLLKQRKLNPNPQVRVLQESPVTAVLDGDGSLGHFACWQAAHLAVERAKTVGLGAVATRNHHHFGAAGVYSRVASEAGCVGFAVSSHLRSPAPEQQIMSAGGASPMSFAIPSGSEPPLALDMATNV
jgi:LDH2 family malate/lactate/ureidoglycolate dehydrogenase